MFHNTLGKETNAMQGVRGQDRMPGELRRSQNCNNPFDMRTGTRYIHENAAFRINAALCFRKRHV